WPALSASRRSCSWVRSRSRLPVATRHSRHNRRRRPPRLPSPRRAGVPIGPGRWRGRNATAAIPTIPKRWSIMPGRCGPMATALRIVPDEPSVLSNLGLSYALSKDLVRAEATLRRAAVQSRVDSRVQENPALVMDLQGRTAGAGGLARADLPAAEANVAYLRQ